MIGRDGEIVRKMAKRPIYICIEKKPYYERAEYEFDFYGGFAISQKQKCIKSLHDSFRGKNPDLKVIEISSKSTEELGVKLSAFNLTYRHEGKEYTVESLFQGSKVFENGGPYTDIYTKSSFEAKKDDRIHNSGKVIGFTLFDEEFSSEPKTFFYDWLYVNALNSHEDIREQIVKYDAFTDIEFNPQKSFNCQAEAVAIFVSLSKTGMIEDALKSKEKFLKIVFGCENQKDDFKQMNLWDLLN